MLLRQYHDLHFRIFASRIVSESELLAIRFDPIRKISIFIFINWVSFFWFKPDRNRFSSRYKHTQQRLTICASFIVRDRSFQPSSPIRCDIYRIVRYRAFRSTSDWNRFSLRYETLLYSPKHDDVRIAYRIVIRVFSNPARSDALNIGLFIRH